MTRHLSRATCYLCATAYSLLVASADTGSPPEALVPPPKALISAIRAGETDAALALLGSSIQLDLPVGRDDTTLLHISARSGLPEVVDLLLHLGASPAVRDTRGRSALHHFAEATKPAFRTLDSLLGTGLLLVDDLDTAGKTPLLLATERGDLFAAKALFAAGADPQAQSLDGLSPQGIAQTKRKTALVHLFAGTSEPAQPNASASQKGGYPAPDLSSPLLDRSALTMPPAAQNLLIENLALLGRNFPDSPLLDQDLRARALAVALSLDRRHRPSVVADAQLRRGIKPAPLPSTSTPLSLATAFRNFTQRLAPATLSNDDRLLAALLLDIAARIDPLTPTTGFPRPDWSPAFTATAQPPRLNSNKSLTQAAPLPVDHASVRTIAFAGTGSSGSPVFSTVDISSTAAPRPAHAPTTAVRFTTPDSGALTPAVTLSKTLQPWPGGYQLVLSLPRQSAAADAPTAGLASALLVASHFSSKPLDPNIAVIAGISPTGTLSNVSDTEARLRAAIESGCKTVILSSDAVPAIADAVVLGATDLVRDLQVYAVHDLPAAFAIATASPPYAEASSEFLLLQALTKSGRLSAGEAVSRLRAIARSTPGHLSSALLVAAASGTLPKQLSPPTSANKIRTLARRLLEVIDPKRGYPHPTQFEAELLGTISSKLTRHRPLLAPQTRQAADATTDLATLLSKYLHSPPRSGDGNRKMAIALKSATAHLKAKLAELKALASENAPGSPGSN